MACRISRSVSLAASLIGAFVNAALAFRLLALWRSLGWEYESEWEAAADAWRVDSVKVIWGLLSAYFAAAAFACFIGFVGIAKNILSYIRFYRDYSIADFSFVLVTTIFASYTTFSSAQIRASVCEELGRHPDLMRDMTEMGLSIENCEIWFERAVIAVVAVILVLIVMRVHVVIALSKYYNRVSRDIFQSSNGKGRPVLKPVRTDSLHRIYLLPTPTASSFDSSEYNFNNSTSLASLRPKNNSSNNEDDVVVYAPVSISSLSKEDALAMNATEAWISTETPRSHRHSSHLPSRSHSHSHRTYMNAAPSSRSATSAAAVVERQWPSDEKNLVDL